MPGGVEAVGVQQVERVAEFLLLCGREREQATRYASIARERLDPLCAEQREVVLAPLPDELGVVAAVEADGVGVVVRRAAHEEARVA